MRHRKNQGVHQPLHRDTCTESEEDFEYMRQLLKRYRKCVNRPARYHDPPLHEAFGHNHLKCMKFLLENGANPNGLNGERNSVMDFALNDENFAVAELLLQHGLDPDYRRSREGSFFSWGPSDPNIVKMMFDKGAVTDEIKRNFLSPSNHISLVNPYVFHGETEIVKLFLLHNAITDFSNMPPRFRTFSAADTIPHSIIKTYEFAPNLNKTLEVKKRLFNMIHQFGVNFNQKDTKGHTVLETLKLDSDQDSKVLAQFVSELLSAPLNLQSLSRLAVKKVLGRELVRCTEDFVGILPPPLIEFLKYSKE